VEIGKGIIRKEGADITLAAVSFMAHESMKAADELTREGIDVELIDLRSVKPIDEDIVLESVEKTGRLVIADGGWKTCGLAAEVSAMVSENGWRYLKAPIKRVTLPDCPAPASSALERIYYPGVEHIVDAVKQILGKENAEWRIKSAL